VPEAAVRLYHFTSPERLTAILAEGVIRTTESNIGSGRPDLPPCGDHVGPDVVWLTDRQEPDARGLALDLQIDGTDKTGVRITVEVPDAEHWPAFATAYGMNATWRRAMEEDRAPQTWWVVARPITMIEVIAIEAAEP
jgi:hypothetical protein